MPTYVDRLGWVPIYLARLFHLYTLGLISTMLIYRVYQTTLYTEYIAVLSFI